VSGFASAFDHANAEIGFVQLFNFNFCWHRS
jgi:hypothetical protein